MRKKELTKILQKRKKECQKYLDDFHKQLKELRTEEEIGYDREILGGMQHQIGYMTGLICEINNTIKLLNMSMDEYSKEKRLVKKYEKAQREELLSILEDRSFSKH